MYATINNRSITRFSNKREEEKGKKMEKKGGGGGGRKKKGGKYICKGLLPAHL